MQDPYGENQTPLPYQANTQPAPTPYQDGPGPMHPPPYMPPETPRRSAGGARTGAIIALTLLLALIFGVGLFAGWQFGRTSNTGTNTSALQTGTAPAATVPPLNGNNLQAVREAVIAKVRPAVVQINVTVPGG